MRNIKPIKAIIMKREIRKLKLECYQCGKRATCFYHGKSYCKSHYPKPKKEQGRGRITIAW